jgi:hypothetical protein
VEFGGSNEEKEPRKEEEEDRINRAAVEGRYL